MIGRSLSETEQNGLGWKENGIKCNRVNECLNAWMKLNDMRWNEMNEKNETIEMQDMSEISWEENSPSIQPQ